LVTSNRGAAIEETSAAFISARPSPCPRRSGTTYVWTKTADEILDNLTTYCNTITASGH